MRRKLVFHIGHHKTGSTTIQDAFATGRVSLTSGHILYPGRMAHNYLTRHFETFATKGKLLAGSDAFPGLQAISDRLRTEEYEVAVLSGEEFEGADPRAVQKVLREFFLPHVTDHAVICYVRPHAARILSSFAENVKLGLFGGTPEDFFEKVLKNRRFHYARKLMEWDKVFGGNFRLRPMIRGELAGGSVLQDFVETAFGPERPVTTLPVAAANESLCLEDLLMVKLVQERLALRDRKLRHAMGWQIAPALADMARSEGAGTRLMLHKALAERIRAAYRGDARDLDARFFGGRPLMQGELDRAVDEAVPKAQSFDPKDHFSADTLRAVAVLGGQIDQMLDHESGSWHAFLVERRIARLHRAGEKPARLRGEAPAVAKPRAATGRAERVGATPDAGSVLDLKRLEQMVEVLPREGGIDLLSRRLGNILMQVSRSSVLLKPGEVIQWLDDGRFPEEVRAVLKEFLLNLFFYRFAAKLVEPEAAASPIALMQGKAPRAEVLRHLTQREDYVAAMAVAGIHYLRGDLVAAYDGFDLARQRLLAEGRVQHHNRGVLSLRSMPVLAGWAAGGEHAVLPPLEMESDRRFGDDLPIVVVGMDGGYYRRYAARLVETAQGRANLHFHVANPQAADLLTAPHLRHSFETVADAPNAYFATMRFLRLPDLLRHYDRPLATMDADAQFVAPVQPLFDRLVGQDILLNATTGLNQPRRYLAAVPWRHVTAQIMVAAPTPGGQAFLDVFGRLYGGLTQGGAAPTWWVDQALLAQTADLCRHEGRAVRIRKEWLHRFAGMQQGKL